MRNKILIRKNYRRRLDTKFRETLELMSKDLIEQRTS